MPDNMPHKVMGYLSVAKYMCSYVDLKRHSVVDQCVEYLIHVYF